MSIHYAKYSNSVIRVEYIGRKQRNDYIKTIHLGGDYVLTLSFSPDGTRILFNLGRGVYIWDATGGELIAGPLLAEDEDDIFSASYLPDGRHIIVDSGKGIIKKWDVITNRLVSERMMSDFEIDSTWVVSVTFSPDRKSVVFGYNQGRIRIWNVDTGEQDSELLEGHTDYVNCLSFSSDGKYLASGSYDTTIVIWDMDKREAVTGPLRRHTEEVTAVDFCLSGTNIVSGSSDGTILVWDVSTGEVLREIICEGEVYSVRYSPNGFFIFAGGKGWMSMWNVADITAAPKVFQVGGYVRLLSFSPDGSRFMFFGSDVIRIWDASWSVEETQSAFEGQEEINLIALCPYGELVASGSWKGSISVWSVLTSEVVKKLELGSGVHSIAFSPINEHLIAFGTYDGAVQLWDFTNDEPIEIESHIGLVNSVVFSPSDGKHIASGSEDKIIHICNIEREEIAVSLLIGHEDAVLTVAYSPDGTRLVSGSWDNTVRIWNSRTGDLLSILNVHSHSVDSVAYSFDGARIVSGSDDSTILV